LSYRLLACFGILFLMTACGFQPLYGEHNDNAGTRDALSKIEINFIADRLGQQVYNYLLDRISPLGKPGSPLYSLDVRLNLFRQDLGVSRDETATRAKLIFSATYRLIDKKNGKQLFLGSTQTANSFTIVDSAFANFSAENDAIDRAAREVSDSIRLRLALYFATQPGA
jgi:LPS-assembly lipoprotein